MTTQEPTPEDYLDIADKVRSGEYFREARNMYDIDVHDVMTDRYFYIVLTVLSIIICVVAVSALESLYPLERSVPFIFPTQDIIEDVPRIKPIAAPGEDPNEAMLRFLIVDYVKAREEFDINSFDRARNLVQAESSTDAFNEFSQFVAPGNPQSPVALYQRKAVRSITVVSVQPEKDGEFGMKVIYDASVSGGVSSGPDRYQADIAFQYDSIKIDEKTGEVTPYGFRVTAYRTKRL